jgi:thymidylate kinase
MILICFIGIDGSGKSTLSKYLYEELKRRNYNVSYTWWLEGEDSFLRRVLRRIGSRSHSSGSNADKPHVKNNNLKTKLFCAVYPRLVLLDYLRFGILKTWRPRLLHTQIIIFDRYIYDVILALSTEFSFSDVRKKRLFSIFNKLLPVPDLIFLINVPPEVAYSRKSEEIESIETAQLIWNNYQQMYAVLDNITPRKILRIDNTRELETVKAEILDASVELLKMR